MVSEPAQSGGRQPLWRRAFAAGEWQGPHGARSVSDWIVDAALFTFAAVMGALALGYLWPSHGMIVDAVDTAAGALACLALWVRRSSRAAVLATMAAAAFSPLAAGAGLVAICTAAARARGRILAVAVAVIAVGSILFPVLNPAVGELVPVKQSFPGVVFTAVAVGWGLYLRARREQVASLRERARQLEAAQEHSAELARQAERRRIAREMHDVLAHRLSLLSVHAGALEFRPDASAAEVAQAAAVIRSSASAALSDLREVVTVLREDTAGPPSPAFAQIPALIEESRAAGMTVEAHIEVQDAESLPPVLGRTAYRVVQEGLTNARRHAPGAAVAVTVAGNGRPGVIVEITSAGSADALNRGAAHPGAGAGLIGLAERVALVGGTLKHETSPAGEFVLRATIPRPS